jgi:hypothetical protein
VVEGRLAQGFGERGREHRLGGGGKAQVRGIGSLFQNFRFLGAR